MLQRWYKRRIPQILRGGRECNLSLWQREKQQQRKEPSHQSAEVSRGLLLHWDRHLTSRATGSGTRIHTRRPDTPQCVQILLFEYLHFQLWIEADPASAFRRWQYGGMYEKRCRLGNWGALPEGGRGSQKWGRRVDWEREWSQKILPSKNDPYET